MRAIRRSLPAIWLALGVFLLAGCGGQPLDSSWRDRPVAIDGQDDEWEGARVLLKDSRVGLGLMNDADSLYLTVSLTGAELGSRLARQGFTIWFDPLGGKDEVFGIRFPVAAERFSLGRPPEDAAAEGRPGRPPRPARGTAGSGPGQLGRPDARQLQSLLDSLFARGQMELLGPVEGERAMRAGTDDGPVTLRASYTRGRLVYELRVPLNLVSEPFQRERVAGLGFEIPAPEMAEGMGGDMGGPPGGGMGPGGGGPGGMRGGGRRAGGLEGSAPEEFRIWTKVRLAVSPGTTSVTTNNR